MQTWNALTFTDPEAAQRHLWERLKSSYGQNKKTEALRILDFWSRSENRLNILFQQQESENLEQLKKNSVFAGAWKALLHHNSEVFWETFVRNPEFITMLNDESEGGIAVQITKDLKDKVESVKETLEPPLYEGVLQLLEFIDDEEVRKLAGAGPRIPASYHNRHDHRDRNGTGSSLRSGWLSKRIL